jgi:hypothetical protein
VFSTFFLLGPLLAAVLQLLLLNVLLLAIFQQNSHLAPPDSGLFIVSLIGAMELSGFAEAILVVLFDFPQV